MLPLIPSNLPEDLLPLGLVLRVGEQGLPWLPLGGYVADEENTETVTAR